MKLQLSVALADEANAASLARCTVEIAECGDIAALGLGLADAKAVLGWLQSTIVKRQLDGLRD